MKSKQSLLLAVICVLFISCSSKKDIAINYNKNYKPDDIALYNVIAEQDSIFFHYYNTCDKNLDKYGEFYLENIEFYHDQGGLMTSKKELVAATQKNICGKVTRILVKGILEVFPIHDFGAIEIGLHQFRNNQEPANTRLKTGRFMIVWKNDNNTWRISRVVSLH
jgi:Domain of unknown function (DUF4440)